MSLTTLIDDAVLPVPPPPNIKPGDKYATHAGEITIADIKLRVYVLNTGERIFNADDLKVFLEPLGLAGDLP